MARELCASRTSPARASARATKSEPLLWVEAMLRAATRASVRVPHDRHVCTPSIVPVAWTSVRNAMIVSFVRADRSLAAQPRCSFSIV
jgi:hypothetical protein